MEIDQRIPDLSDKELDNLHANAVRLSDSGTPIQRQHAERLLPLVVAALAERRAAKVAAQEERRRATAKSKAAARTLLKEQSK